MKKGFTLIELLAVIVILAIIALIATPIILNIINDSRASAKERSAELIVSNVKSAYSLAYAKTYPGGTSAGEVPTLEEIKDEVSLQNISIVTIDEDGNLRIESRDNVLCVFSNSSGNLIGNCYDDINADIESATPYSSKTTQITSGQSMSLSGSARYSIYRMTEDHISIGDSLDAFVSGYSTEKEGFDGGLKHDIVDGVVVATYACLSETGFDGVQREACVRGGDPSYYGTYDGMSSTTVYDVSNLNPQGNIAILSNFKSRDGDCTFSNSSSGCYLGMLSASSNGSVTVNPADFWDCFVDTNGSSYCIFDD